MRRSVSGGVRNWIQILFGTARISSEGLDTFSPAERTVAELGLLSLPETF